MVTFKEATDAIGLSAGELAELFDRPAQSIRQMRLDPDHPNHRPPPPDWRSVLATVARQRGQELQELVMRLERR